MRTFVKDGIEGAMSGEKKGERGIERGVKNVFLSLLYAIMLCSEFPLLCTKLKHLNTQRHLFLCSSLGPSKLLFCASNRSQTFS